MVVHSHIIKLPFTDLPSSAIPLFTNLHHLIAEVSELSKMARSLQADVKRLGGRLVKQLIRRDCLVAKRDYHCNWITAYLQANSEKRSE